MHFRARRRVGDSVGGNANERFTSEFALRYALLVRRLLLVLLIAGCSQKAPVEPWEGPVATGDEVAIPALGISLSVPPGTETQFVGDGATFYVSPEARAARSFSIGAGDPALVHDGAATRHEKVLKGGNRIRYELRTANEGSGGPESYLDGVIVVGQDVFAVHCHDQAPEMGTPDAQWCLQWLATARPQ